MSQSNPIAAAEKWVIEEGWRFARVHEGDPLRVDTEELRARLAPYKLDDDEENILIDKGADLAVEAAQRPNGSGPLPPQPDATRLTDGGSFILDAPEKVAAVWGRGQLVAHAAGEPLLIVGPQGVGKTTLAQRLALARVGLASSVLGLNVEPDERRVLYIAADRPRQVQRSFRRMVDEHDRPILRDRLVVWRGQLPFVLTERPDALATWAASLNVGTVYIDSVKDVALDLSREETGTRFNIALQELVTAKIEVVGTHHQRKAQGDNKKPTKLDDVYGSAWLTAGCGSVLLLWGAPGDVIVELSHLKQPAEEIGPWTIAIDHATGALAVQDATDLAALLATNPAGVTAKDTAATLTGKTEPSRSDVEKARRKLEALIGEGIARRIEPLIPGDPVKYAERTP